VTKYLEFKLIIRIFHNFVNYPYTKTSIWKIISIVLPMIHDIINSTQNDNFILSLFDGQQTLAPSPKIEGEMNEEFR